jgi:hypothetical protein
MLTIDEEKQISMIFKECLISGNKVELPNPCWVINETVYINLTNDFKTTVVFQNYLLLSGLHDKNSPISVLPREIVKEIQYLILILPPPGYRQFLDIFKKTTQREATYHQNSPFLEETVLVREKCCTIL